MRTISLAGLMVLTACATPSASSAPSPPRAPNEVAPAIPIHAGEHLAHFVFDRIDQPTKIEVPDPRAKITMLVFWATWCPSSVRWLAATEELKKRYESAGLAVVGISQDDVEDAEPSRVAAIAQKWGATYPIVLDHDRKIATAIRPGHWQSIVIVDAKGLVTYTHVGTYEGAEAEVAQEVAKELAL